MLIVQKAQFQLEDTTTDKTVSINTLFSEMKPLLTKKGKFGYADKSKIL